MDVEIEVSARHVHFSEADFKLLFGPEAKYREVRELSQSGEFVTDKEIEIVGPKSTLSAKFLSPFRDETQAEISLTDCRTLGVDASYETKIYDGCVDITLKSEICEIQRCAAMVAIRHLHANPDEAKKLGLVDGENIGVEIITERGRIVLYDIHVKIADSYNLRIHLDTDEGNAAGIKNTTRGRLILKNDSSN